MNVWVQLERLIGEPTARVEYVLVKLLAGNALILAVSRLYKWNSLMHWACLSDLDVYRMVDNFRDEIAGSR